LWIFASKLTQKSRFMGSLRSLSGKKFTFQVNFLLSPTNSYVTAPVAGAARDTRAIVGTQYTGKVEWVRMPPYGTFIGDFLQGASYRAIVTLRANTGYTFAGLGNKSFTYAGADDVDTMANGRVNVDFPELGPVWYVADFGKDNDVNYDGSTRLKALNTMKRWCG
jgi:hypothetical protein